MRLGAGRAAAVHGKSNRHGTVVALGKFQHRPRAGVRLDGVAPVHVRLDGAAGAAASEIEHPGRFSHGRGGAVLAPVALSPCPDHDDPSGFRAMSRAGMGAGPWQNTLFCLIKEVLDNQILVSYLWHALTQTHYNTTIRRCGMETHVATSYRDEQRIS